jgi:hypothetical protein
VLADDPALLPMSALAVSACLADGAGEAEEAERDASNALAIAGETDVHLAIPDALECLAGLAADAGSHREAARLHSAADPVRQDTAQSDSRSTTTGTRPRFTRSVMYWAPAT